jgi:hypothetical protein
MPRHRQMLEINDLHRIMWENAGQAGPFSPMPPTLQYPISHATPFASVHFCPPSGFFGAGSEHG